MAVCRGHWSELRPLVTARVEDAVGRQAGGLCSHGCTVPFPPLVIELCFQWVANVRAVAGHDSCVAWLQTAFQLNKPWPLVSLLI